MQARSQAKPITCRVKGRTFVVTAVGRDAYRIRMAPEGADALENGTHLDPRRPVPVYRIKGNAVSGACSELALAASGRMTLQGERRETILTLTPWQNGLLLRSRRAGQCYGGGDSAARTRRKTGLLKTGSVKAFLGNGISHVPFLWHTSGWSVWALSEDVGAELKSMDSAGKSFFVRNTALLTDIVVMAAPTLADAVRILGELAGRPPTPPLWTLGFLHTRWGYKNWTEIRRTLRMFRERGHPVDAFIYDFESYTRQPDYGLPAGGRATFADFGWNPQCFPDPLDNMAEARSLGVQTVLIRKPRLGNAYLLRMAAEHGWKITTWPGQRRKKKGTAEKYAPRVIDFRRADVRAWYWQRHRRFVEDGVAGWWNDEGEQFPTLYYWWNRALADGQAHDFPDKRFWSINRAYSVGLARLGGAVWTGDSKTGWDDLRLEASKLLNYGLAGMPWAACDLGGFNGDPGASLMTRYMQAGVFFPIMRTHSSIRNKARLPWNFGETAETAMREANKLRMRLLPYTYSLAHETYENGLPLARPMVLEFPGRTFADTWRQWMFGAAFLAAPVLDSSGHVQVLLPRGCVWYDFFSGRKNVGGQTMTLRCGLRDIPLWQRGGSIAALAPVVQHVGELVGRPLEIRVATSSDASFRLTEDDGSTMAYRRGEKLTTVWQWNEHARVLTARASGFYAGMPRRRLWTIRFLGLGPVETMTLDQRPLPQLVKADDERKRGWVQLKDGTVIAHTGMRPAQKALRLTVKICQDVRQPDLRPYGR